MTTVPDPRRHRPLGLLALVTLLAACGSVGTPNPSVPAAGDTAATAPAPDLNALAAGWPVVQRDATGAAVRSAQYLLRQHGSAISADGIFGQATQSAVTAFQNARGLTPDGIVGPATWGQLIVTVQQNSTGEAVRAMQQQLGVSVDGIFGQATQSAVIAFQKAHGLQPDGIVGPDTWRELVAASGGGTPAPAGSRAELARQIDANNRISLLTVLPSGVRDGADPQSNIRDTAAGRAAKRSSYEGAPGGSVYLDVDMLRGMLSVAGKYSYRVTAIAGGSHTVNSRHYAGLAFDVDLINGRAVNAGNPSFRGLLQACRDAGATELLGPGDAGHSTHTHCGWPR